MVEMTLEDLKRFVSDCCSAAVQDYVKGVDPERDKVKQSEAKRYLKSRGFMPVMLKRWTSIGLLHPQKTGETQNCATMYSLAELKQAISAMRLKAICNASDADYNAAALKGSAQNHTAATM